MIRTHTIPVEPQDDVFETICKWMKKNRYKKEVVKVCGGLLEETRFYKNGHMYFINGQLFNENDNTVEFEIMR